MSVWGKGPSLASRLKANEAKNPSSAPPPAKPAPEAFKPVHHPEVHHRHHYRPHATDGSQNPPKATALHSNFTAAIALIAVQDDKILLVQSTDGGASTGSSSENKSSAFVRKADKSDDKSGTQEATWSLPSGLLDKIESVQAAAIRVGGDEGSLVVPTALVALEHYPSLQQNWIRLAVACELVTGADETDTRKMFPLESVLSEAVPVAGDHLTLIRHYHSKRSVALPQAVKECGFPYLLVEAALVHKDRALLVKASHGSGASSAGGGEKKAASASSSLGLGLDASADAAATKSDSAAPVSISLAPSSDSSSSAGTTATAPSSAGDAKLSTDSSAPASVAAPAASANAADSDWWWTLPQTHVDRGETVGFAGGRVARALFGLTVDMQSVAHVEHSGRSDMNLDGARFTLHASLDAALPMDPAFDAKSASVPEHIWAGADDLRKLASENRLRDDLLAVLLALLAERDLEKRGVPLIAPQS